MQPIDLMHFGLYVVTGFVAQLVGSSLGMCYGTICSGVLLSTGLPPTLVSVSSNMASCISAGSAAIFHLKAGNVEKTTFVYLAVPGIIGAISGALILTVISESIVKPLIAGYLLFLSLVIIYRVLRSSPAHAVSKRQMATLGTAGGFVGAVSGAGWGPLVNSNMVANGHSPRHAIGSSLAAKVVVDLIAAVMLIAIFKGLSLITVAGLVLGGLLAAPIGPQLCKTIPRHALMVSMAVLLMGMGGINLHHGLNKQSLASKSSHELAAISHTH